MIRFVKLVGVIVVLGFFGYIFRNQIESGYVLFKQDYFPCKTPIEYSLGDFDTKFGISKEAFLADLKLAEDVWEKSAGKDLFNYSEDGSLKVNLIYDYRQETTDKLSDLSSVVKDNQNSYNELRTRHDSLLVKYQELKVSYESRLTAYENRKSAYEQKVDYWNSRGGAPKDEYSELQKEKEALRVEAEALKYIQSELNNMVSEVNSVVDELNAQAKKFNLTAREYNKIGGSLGEEFQEGLYVRSGFTQKIDIYEFNNKEKLVRVLAHEFGHALGLEHVSDPLAIMYKTNQGTNYNLTDADIKALNDRCGIK